MRARLSEDESSGTFSNQLFELGEIGDTESDLMNADYSDLNHSYCDKTWLCERAILVPRNDPVNHTKFKLLSRLPSQFQVYKSFDTSFNTL